MRSLKFFLLFVFLLSVSGWSWCDRRSYQVRCSGGVGSCSTCPNTYNTPVDVHYSVSGRGAGYAQDGTCGETGTITMSCSGTMPFEVTSATYDRTCVGADFSARAEFSGYLCSDECAADSLRCVGEGNQFQRNGDNCECIDVCGQMRAQCESSGGSFEGRALTQNGETCCSAVCNRCNDDANDRIDALKTKYCCEAGFAPPAESQSCYSPPGISGCGMTTLQRLNNTLDYQCRDPNSSQEASEAYYSKCFPCEGEDCPNSSSSGGDPGSSSGGGDSSSGGGSSGSNYPEGCDECPWLDSILDTLTAQKSLVESMYLCVVYPSMCDNSNSETDSVVVNVDSVILAGVKDRQDSVKNLLHNLLDVNGHIDTTLLSIYENLGGSSFDTTLRKIVVGGFSSVDTGLIRINGNIVDMDNNTRHRLDTLISRIPAGIFDSIRKYQDSSIDLLDTLLWGKGVGFSLVDSLTDTVVKYFKKSHYYDSLYVGRVDSLRDSVVKYFKVSNHYDSLYMVKFDEFDSALMDRLDNMTIGTDFDALGYGDTATSTLRADLSDFRSAIEEAIASFDSSVSSELENLVDEQKSFYSSATGYGDGTSTLKGDLEGIKEAIEGIQGGNSYLDSQLRLGSYDTNSTYNGYLSGYDTSAVEFANNLGGALSGALADSTYKGIFDLNSSSSGSNDDYRLIDIDSAQAALKASNDSTKSALADTMQTWFNELRNDFMLVNFDSAIIAPLGAKVPNTNTCPEDCFKIDLSGAGGAFSGVKGFSWGLCEARIGNMNVLQFIRLILRIVTALTCVYIGLWFVSGRKS